VCAAGNVCLSTPSDALCDDGARCTTDVCDAANGDPVTGCRHDSIPGCCRTNADCRNTNPCDGEEGCFTCTGCFLHDWPCCRKGRGTASACVAGQPLPEGAPCNDGDACSLGDTCQAGQCAGLPDPACQPATPSCECADGDPCTTDSCDAQGRCFFQAIGSFDGVLCVFRRLPIAECAAQAFPRSIMGRIDRARELIERAQGARRRERARALARRAVAVAKAALKARMRSQRRGTLTPDCGDALARLLREVRDRARSLARQL
jgi:hypothetical protein